MNFNAAYKAMINGGKVRFNNVTYSLDEGELINDATGDSVTLTAALLDATFAIVEAYPALTGENLYAYFDTNDRRWKSTVNPAEQVRRGRQVRQFSAIVD